MKKYTTLDNPLIQKIEKHYSCPKEETENDHKAIKANTLQQKFECWMMCSSRKFLLYIHSIMLIQ